MVSRSRWPSVEPAGGGLGEVGDRAGVADERGVAGAEHGQQRLLDLAGGGHAARVLLGVHALVGDAQGLGGRRWPRSGARSRRRSSRSRSPRPARSAPARRRQQRHAVLEARLEQRAELVAAHPEDRPARAEEGRSCRPGARRHVAGGVAEGVVVVLEAVEVEQRAARPATRAWRSPRASSSARVSARRLPSPVRASVSASSREVAQHADVLAEGQRQPDHHEHERGRGEPDGERVEVAQRAVDEQLERRPRPRPAERRSGAA